ncbi:hypothetical protein [Olleya namhaensis]|uniref:hypothetical protein n=1 Tax=Olleya namhaensis TaxID=1144750 RepID=UPI002492FD77|nr:hypothetical protein [Olleya namhaensis]
MKTAIITLGLIASSTLFANAAELDLLDQQLLTDTSITLPINTPIEPEADAETQIYQWSVKTTTGVFTGTAENLKDANNQIAMVSKTATILQKDITSINLSKAKSTEQVYTWGVVTDRGYATGVATSADQAEKMVKLMGNTEVPKSKIIESFKPNK